MFKRREPVLTRPGCSLNLVGRGRPVGTANYMAPERILQLPLDPQSDLFSRGVVIYEMATGRLPFAGASPKEIVTRQSQQLSRLSVWSVLTCNGL